MLIHCRDCIYWTKERIGRGVCCLFSDEEDGYRHYTDKNGYCAWAETGNEGESIEDVLRDMLQCIDRLEENGSCDAVEGMGACHMFGESFDPCYVVFQKRLKALGIEV